ncbi:hypothetical protein KEM48_001903 [Puccinia striiformis f. sp. tritici PST-130]|nr:hypothetical protein KEM48_001903 [Puccinia striiformis f. sp. tritici PST-130]
MSDNSSPVAPVRMVLPNSPNTSSIPQNGPTSFPSFYNPQGVPGSLGDENVSNLLAGLNIASPDRDSLLFSHAQTIAVMQTQAGRGDDNLKKAEDHIRELRLENSNMRVNYQQELFQLRTTIESFNNNTSSRLNRLEEIDSRRDQVVKQHVPPPQHNHINSPGRDLAEILELNGINGWQTLRLSHRSADCETRSLLGMFLQLKSSIVWLIPFRKMRKQVATWRPMDLDSALAETSLPVAGGRLDGEVRSIALWKDWGGYLKEDNRSARSKWAPPACQDGFKGKKRESVSEIDAARKRGGSSAPIASGSNVIPIGQSVNVDSISTEEISYTDAVLMQQFSDEDIVSRIFVS